MRLFPILLLLMVTAGCRSAGTVSDANIVDAAGRSDEVTESGIYEGEYNRVLSAAERAASEIGSIRSRGDGTLRIEAGPAGASGTVEVALYQLEHSRVQVDVTVNASGAAEASALLQRYLRALHREVRR